LDLISWNPIKTENLVADLNAQTNRIRAILSANALTLLSKQNTAAFPIAKGKKVAYIAIGAPAENSITAKMRTEYGADIYLFGSKAQIGRQLMDDKTNIIPADKSDSSSALQLINTIQQKNYDAVVVGLHNYSRRPANNFGLSNASVYLLNGLQQPKTVTLVFGNPYAIQEYQ
jgi:beta-N-acetylhexosaminidase